MTQEEKRLQIEESYLNGQMEQAAEQFRKLSKPDRKDLVTNALYQTYYQTSDVMRLSTLKYSCFLIDLI